MNWDQLITGMFVKNHLPNQIYCDVGSCQGVFTKLFNQLAYPNGKVYAFEINPDNPEISNCIFNRIAISDHDGVEELYLSGSHMSNILGHDVGYHPSKLSGFINSTTLDTYFKDIPLDVLKIDIEGAELKAIKGGLNTIKKCRIVNIECHLDEHWEDIFNLLDGMEFKDLVNNEYITRDKRPYQIYKLT